MAWIYHIQQQQRRRCFWMQTAAVNQRISLAFVESVASSVDLPKKVNVVLEGEPLPAENKANLAIRCTLTVGEWHLVARRRLCGCYDGRVPESIGRGGCFMEIKLSLPLLYEWNKLDILSTRDGEDDARNQPSCTPHGWPLSQSGCRRQKVADLEQENKFLGTNVVEVMNRHTGNLEAIGRNADNIVGSISDLSK
eukprot:scaffold1457_cov185-Amphora_coffeaeformis.AAC.7